MKKLIVILLIITSSTDISLSQEFKINSIGVAFIKTDSEKVYELEIVFPFKVLSNYKIQRPILELKEIITKFINNSSVTLFDEKGELATINIQDSIDIRFWCENDGGIQYRPTVTIKIEKQLLKRKLKSSSEVVNVSCFVITNKNADKLISIPDNFINEKVKLKGDINGDGKIEAVVWAEPDDSGICELSFHLLCNEEDYYLNCCGP
jgi:hypothetical protein